MGKPARAKLPVARERQEQAALFGWLAVAAPPGLWFGAIPGGDGRETRAPGYVAGTPDVLLIWAGRPILLEIKRRRGGVVSAEQTAAHAAIALAGGVVVVGYGWEDAAAQLRMIIPMRSRVAA
jgi:hypothetical protein